MVNFERLFQPILYTISRFRFPRSSKTSLEIKSARRYLFCRLLTPLIQKHIDERPLRAAPFEVPEEWGLSRLAADDVLFQFARHYNVDCVRTSDGWEYLLDEKDDSKTSALYVAVKHGGSTNSNDISGIASTSQIFTKRERTFPKLKFEPNRVDLGLLPSWIQQSHIATHVMQYHRR